MPRMPSMIIHDRRLQGKTPARYNYVMQVNAGTSLRHILQTVRHYGMIRKLSPLHILCHGYEADWNLRDQMCMPQAHGGFGLQLGRDNLSLFNVSGATEWKGLVDTIVVFACAVADTPSYNRGTWGDGRRFVGELALNSGARVIAGRDTQYYTASGGGTIDFGAWEGPVYEFSPDTPDGERVIDPSVYRVQG
jgi:hypothetical protein